MLPLKDDLHFKSSFDVSDEHDKSLRRQSPDPEIQKYQGVGKIEAFSLSLKTAIFKVHQDILRLHNDWFQEF